MDLLKHHHVINSVIRTNNNNNFKGNLKIAFWNIEGERQFNLMCDKDISTINQNHIIGLCETWAENDYFRPAFSRFRKVSVLAKRDVSVGRAKGGIIIYYRNDIFKKHECLSQTDHYIILKLWAENFEIIIGCVYIQP